MNHSVTNPLDRARDLVDAADRIVVFTGAGMSAESGIATFRDALTGMWENHDPMVLASPDGWDADRDMVWAWYRERAAQVRSTEPNAGHLAIARLADEKAVGGGSVQVVTQNVDDLHERAGSTVDAHLHGGLFAPRCEACDRPEPPDVALVAPRPDCPVCGASIRPGVVWFGEMLPATDWQRADEATRTCDLMLVVGTSGVVYPAAELPERAYRAGTPIIEVNPDVSALTRLATVPLVGSAAELLPALAER
ncbi:SIR2 family NAD-dependent protein deacylase [Gordonia zhaorongruii]|uniref:SIR2 family NAD-dependent protein deacylase n=1 Tax=Gordonia zhaorongruii TaxID=2597659 RepID=UPI00104CAA29|nr:NAD-dependent deacylase [Gordonia zhaorongruii]